MSLINNITARQPLPIPPSTTITLNLHPDHIFQTIQTILQQSGCKSHCNCRNMMNVLAHKVEKLRRERDTVMGKYVEEVYQLQRKLRDREEEIRGLKERWARGVKGKGTEGDQESDGENVGGFQEEYQQNMKVSDIYDKSKRSQKNKKGQNVREKNSYWYSEESDEDLLANSTIENFELSNRKYTENNLGDLIDQFLQMPKNKNTPNSKHLLKLKENIDTQRQKQNIKNRFQFSLKKSAKKNY